MNDVFGRVNLAAVPVAGLAAFVFSLLWYSPMLFGGVWAAAQGAEATAMPAWKFLVAPLRELITACFLAWLIIRLNVDSWKEAAVVGLVLWLAFYVVQLAGAVIFDGLSPFLGVIHAGDWLVKMLLMVLVLYGWRRPSPSAG